LPALLAGFGDNIIVVFRPGGREKSARELRVSPAPAALSESRAGVSAGGRQMGSDRGRSSGDEPLRATQV